MKPLYDMIAFDQIKDAIINFPVNHFLWSSYPIFLHTDTPDYGIGAYLF